MKPFKCAAMNLEETFYVTNLIFQEKGREKEGKRKGKRNLMQVIQPLWTPWIKKHAEILYTRKELCPF
jgi:hypothetical protein